MNKEEVVRHVRGLDQIEQRTPEWYAAREHMLTASDAAAAIGKNPYESRKQLLNKKVSTTKKPFTGNFATIHGNKYEDEARFKFGRMYNLDTWEVGLFRHQKYKWLGGSPDGIASDGSLIEIKCPIKRKIEHYIPEYYYPQVQLCMEILDIPQCYFIQYQPENIFQSALLDIKVIPRSKEWFAENYPIFESFWEDVLYHRKHPEIEIIKKRNYTKKEPAPRVVQPCYFTYDPEDDNKDEEDTEQQEELCTSSQTPE
jgi:putative phage-type endonuclease